MSEYKFYLKLVIYYSFNINKYNFIKITMKYYTPIFKKIIKYFIKNEKLFIKDK